MEMPTKNTPAGDKKKKKKKNGKKTKLTEQSVNDKHTQELNRIKAVEAYRKLKSKASQGIQYILFNNVLFYVGFHSSKFYFNFNLCCANM